MSSDERESGVAVVLMFGDRRVLAVRGESGGAVARLAEVPFGYAVGQEHLSCPRRPMPRIRPRRRG